MKVLVTGTSGYIGVLLAPILLDHGFDVVGLDTGYYQDGWLVNSIKKFPAWISKDIRNITTEDLLGFDAVVHLAELSNDPLGQHNPKITFDINHKGTVELAKKCIEAGVSRFVYTSSCSVYGLGSNEFKTEESTTNPQTAYAKCKVNVEQDLGKMADDNFCPTFLRNGTAYGPSPRMRFDIVLNNLAGLAWTIKEIKMTSDGTPWRPLVHVLDICEAIVCTLKAPKEIVNNQIFNVGDSKANYQVKEIAQIVADVFPDCTLSFGQSDPDNRSYRVSFDKINTQLPGFKCRQDPVSGANQLREVFERINMPADIFNFRAFTRLKQLEYLIKTKQIDEKFFWV
ncbi:MAG: SDR family oxidoreductase [Proteobacteria bacterium]|nr:SDR family oxidoreductase [Pseudomonadota bacterium]